MRVENFDLNLLRVLDAVLAEQSVTRAARRLNLSQPAVSHSLRRLRAAFGDPLIERVGRRMELTAEGRRLQAEITDILRGVQRALGSADFDPATTTRRFAVAAADAVARRLLSPLLATVRASAPEALVDVRRLHGLETPKLLEEGRLDVAISIAGSLDPYLRSSPLVTLPWRPIVARRPDDPEGPVQMTLQELVARPHAVAVWTRVNEQVDATLAAHGLQRRVALMSESELLVPDLIQDTELVALALDPDPRDRRFRVVDLPVTLAASTYHVWWHPAAEADPAHQWFIRQILRDTDSGTADKRSSRGEGKAR